MDRKFKGTVLALAVAGLFASGKAMADEKGKAEPAKKETVKCQGINECKGKGACQTKANACAGKNGCAGKGWVETRSEKECTAKGGKVVKG